MATAPMELNGKKKVFEENFFSPTHQPSKEEAETVLDNIRKSHPEKDGWVEFEAFVEQIPPEGLWRAVRHHAKYS